MPTESKDTGPSDRVASLVLKRAIFILAVVGLSLLAAFTVLGTVKALMNQDAVYLSIVIKHYPVTIGLPVCALAALVLVYVLEYTAGPIEVEGLGFKFKGAAGPLVFWIACFLAITLSVSTLWSREFSSPIADKFLQELLAEQTSARARTRCMDEQRAKSPQADAAEVTKLCAAAKAP